MPTTLVKSRQKAYKQQSGYCYYCHSPMWSSDTQSQFIPQYKITSRQAKFYQCTAEHLEARQDGGKDIVSNIVAACYFCNQQRHRLKKAPSPDRFKQYVQKRVFSNIWPTAKWLHS